MSLTRLIIITILGLSLFSLAYAYEGLVQCDPSIPIPKPGSCGMCALLQTVQRVFEWIMSLVFIGATGILVYNGVLFYFTQGQPANVKKILDNIKNVVIGIIIVMASFIIVNTILNWFAAPGAPIQFWNNIQCTDGSPSSTVTPTPSPSCDSNGALCRTGGYHTINSCETACLATGNSGCPHQNFLCDNGTMIPLGCCPGGCQVGTNACLP
jgi:hypothetical protein